MRECCFVRLEPRDGEYIAFVSVEDLPRLDGDPEESLSRICGIYRESVTQLRGAISGLERLRKARHPIPARDMWRIGDLVFRLVDDLRDVSAELDDVYGHLVRDLGVKRKWLEKAIIFRRHLPRIEEIPEALNWGRCEKGTRRIAEQIRRGTPLPGSRP